MTDTNLSSISRPDLWEKAREELGLGEKLNLWELYTVWRKYWELLKEPEAITT